MTDDTPLLRKVVTFHFFSKKKLMRSNFSFPNYGLID